MAGRENQGDLWVLSLGLLLDLQLPIVALASVQNWGTETLASWGACNWPCIEYNYMNYILDVMGL